MDHKQAFLVGTTPKHTHSLLVCNLFEHRSLKTFYSKLLPDTWFSSEDPAKTLDKS